MSMTKETKLKQSDSPEETPSVIEPRSAVEIAANWKEYGAKNKQQELRNYIISEMRRVRKEGGPLLLSILEAEEIPREYILREILPGNREFSSWSLALVPGASPPDRDPHGCLVPINKRGKVLAAKVGTRAEYESTIRANAQSIEPEDRFKGSALRTAHAKSKTTYMYKNSPYMVVEVSSEPTDFGTKEAITILRRYGYGIVDVDNPDATANWLVMEVD